MHAALMPRQAAWMLARGAVGLRQCLGPNAFGNALGQSIAAANSSAGIPGPLSESDRQTIRGYFDGSGVGDDALRVNGRTFSEDVAARQAALDPSGIGKMVPQAPAAAGFAYDDPNGITNWRNNAAAAQPSTVRAGDYGGSMERIARVQLGAGASQREINNYVGQLIEINDIKNPRAVGADWDIVLPGAGTPAATSGLGVYGKDIALGEQIKAQAQADAREQREAAQVATARNQGSISDDDIALLSRVFAGKPAVAASVTPPAQWQEVGSGSAMVRGTTIEQVQAAASSANPNTQQVAYLRANPGDPSFLQQVWNDPSVQYVMDHSMVGTLVKGAVGTVGDTVGGATGYNPVANQYYGPYEQQGAMWRTVAGVALSVAPEGLAASAGDASFSAGARLDAIPLPRSAGLGDVSTTTELLAGRLVPGPQGVTLGQRAVAFSDLWELSEMHGVEFALTKEAGSWRLYSGGTNTVSTPLSGDVRVLAHTHPGGSPMPSLSDIRAIDRIYDAQLGMNPSALPAPSRVIFGGGVNDYTPFWPSIR